MDGGDIADDGVDSSNAVGEEAKVNIRCPNGLKFSVHVNLNSTVEDFKSVVAQKYEIPAQQQRLIYKGRIMKDVQTLKSFGLEDNHTVHLVRGFATATPLDSTTITDAGIRNTNSTSTNAGCNGGRPRGRPDFGAGFFPELAPNGSGLGNGSGLFRGLPETEQTQEELVQDPNTIRDITDMPAIQNLVNNPETFLNLYTNNSQICEILDLNLVLRDIPNDPATRLRRMNIAWNLVIMREMMRSNTEFSLEGFNRFRQMYENALLNATTLPGDNRSDLGSNPLGALLGAHAGRTGTENTTSSPAPNTNPLPNPWASAGRNRRIAGRAGNMRSDMLMNSIGGLATGGGIDSASRPQGCNSKGSDMLMSSFGGLATGGGINSASRPQVIPEERYATQLSQLREMGFFDTQENIRALIATAGNVRAAVERLLENSGQ